MVSLNRILLIGNLTKDPELRYTPSGTPVGNLRLAVNSTFKSQSGERKEETCFVTIVVWSRLAEICNQYLKKGRAVFVEGRLLYRSWEFEGKTRSVHEVRADRVQFLGGGPGRAEGTSASAEPEASVRTQDPGIPETASEAGADADIPF